MFELVGSYYPDMNLILLIFRKDCRRFWPEVLFALVTLGLFVAFYPYTWLQHDELPLNPLGLRLTHDMLGTVPPLLIAIIPITWLVVIGRVVQDESLVGDRQYWVTRPIAWPTLLAEKCAFLSIFLVLPFFVALCSMLGRAGLPVLANIPRALLLTLVDTVSFMLPILVLATLTRNFFRLSMTIVGIFAAVLVVGFASDGFSSISTFTPYNDPVSLPLFVITCVTVIVLQYASRTVWLARGLLTLSLLLVLVIAVNPVEGRMLESFFYPLTPESTLPVRLSLAADTSRPITVDTGAKRPSISIPVDVSAVPFGYQIIPEDGRLTIRSADGRSQSSSWQAIYGRRYADTTRYGVVVIQMDKGMLQQMRTGPVTLDLQLALAVYEFGNARRILIPQTGDVAISGLGLCAIDSSASLSPGLTCRLPFRQPPLFLMAAPWTTDACVQDGAVQPNSAVLTAQPGYPNPTPIDVSLTSVLVSAATFSLPASTDTNLTELPPVRLCPGSALSVIPLQLQRRARVHLTMPNYTLPARNR